MTINIELLKCMDEQHALNALRADFDPLLNTPLEAYLVEWIESLIDDADDVEHIKTLLVDNDIGPEETKALFDALIRDDVPITVAILDAINEAGIDTREALEAELLLAKKFSEIAADAGDFLSRLTDLVTTAQE